MIGATLAIVGLDAVQPERARPSTLRRPAATPAQEWRTYDHDLAGTRFSPLAEIDTGNVATLTKTWTYNFPPPPAGRGGGGPLAALLSASQAVPLVVAGVMYFPAGNAVVA